MGWAFERGDARRTGESGAGRTVNYILDPTPTIDVILCITGESVTHRMCMCTEIIQQ